jgi:hypothetical protein
LRFLFYKSSWHLGINSVSGFLPLARLNLARAYGLLGDNAKAHTAYQDLFAQWKDAERHLILRHT